MADNLTISSPDFSKIRKGDPNAIEDAIRLLWLVLNDEQAKRRRQALVWKDIPYVAADYGASAGTWTVAAGDRVFHRYALTGTMLFLAFAYVDTTTSGGMGTGLTLPIPFGLAAAVAAQVGFLALSGTINEIGVISTQSGANRNTLLLERAAGSAWPSSVTNDLDLQGFIALEVG